MHRCSHIFPDGHPCRALARRPGPLCRFHTPQSIQDRADRARRALEARFDPDKPLTTSELKSFWQSYHDIIRNADASELDPILADLMDALDRNIISDRSAGRLLHALVRRRRQHMNEELFRLAEHHQTPRPTGISEKGLFEMLAQQACERMGLFSKQSTH